MKLTKSKLKQIIKEELASYRGDLEQQRQQGLPEDDYYSNLSSIEFIEALVAGLSNIVKYRMADPKMEESSYYVMNRIAQRFIRSEIGDEDRWFENIILGVSAKFAIANPNREGYPSLSDDKMAKNARNVLKDDWAEIPDPGLKGLSVGHTVEDKMVSIIMKNSSLVHELEQMLADKREPNHVKEVLTAAGAVTEGKENMKLTKSKLKQIIKETLKEAGMPSSVVKHKQALAQMTDEEFATQYGAKSEEELRQMAWRHGYGKMSPHYLNRAQRAKKKTTK